MEVSQRGRSRRRNGGPPRGEAAPAAAEPVLAPGPPATPADAGPPVQPSRRRGHGGTASPAVTVHAPTGETRSGVGAAAPGLAPAPVRQSAGPARAPRQPGRAVVPVAASSVPLPRGPTAAAVPAAPAPKSGKPTKDELRLKRELDKRAAREATRDRDTARDKARRAERKSARERAAAAEAAREQEAVRAERERAAMAAEEDALRALLARAAALNALREEARVRVGEVLVDARKRLALRAATEPRVLAELRSAKAKKALKADVKKGTALVKRVTALSDEALPAVLADVAGFNLTRYSSEIAESLVSSVSKAGDVDTALPVIVAMHGRYADFAPALLAALFACLATAVEASGVGAPAGVVPPPAPVAGDAAAGGAASATASAAAPAQRRAWIAAHPVLGAVEAARARCPPPPSDFGGGLGGDSIASDFGTTATTMRGVGGVGGAGSGAAAGAVTDADRDAKTSPGRVRVLLRLLLDLLAAGVYADAPAAAALLLALMGEAGRDAMREARAEAGAAAGGAGGRLKAGGAGGGGRASSTAAPPAAPPVAIVGAAASDSAADAGGGATALVTAPPSPPANPYASPRPLGYAATTDAAGVPAPPPSLSDKTARRLMRELPLLVSLLKGGPEQLLGAPPRRTRRWLATLPPQLRLAWERAHAGEDVDLSRFRVTVTGYDDVTESWDAPDAAAASAVVDAPALHAAAAGAVAAPPRPRHPSAAATGAAAATTPAAAATATAASPPPLPSLLFSPVEQAALRRGFDRYFDAGARALLTEFVALRRAEKAADVVAFQKGDVPERMAAALDAQRAGFERLQLAVAALAEALDRDLPSLPEGLDDDDGAGVIGGGISVWSGALGGGAGALGPFDDEATRAFYRDLLNLRDTVPHILLDPDGAGAGAAGPTGASSAAAAAATVAAAPVVAPVSAAAPPPAPVPAPTRQRHEVTHGESKASRGTLDSALASLSSVAAPLPLASHAAGAAASAMQKPPPMTAQASVSGATVADATGAAAAAAASGGAAAGRAPTARAPVPTPSSVTLTDRDDDEDDEGRFRPRMEVAALLAAAGVDASAGAGGDVPATAADASSSASRSSAALRFRSLLDGLPRLGSREAVDAWVHAFVMEKLCTKANRARLLHALFTAGAPLIGAAPPGGQSAAAAAAAAASSGSGATELFPLYARLAATLDAALPGFGAPLVELLADEFRFLMRRGGSGGGGTAGGARRPFKPSAAVAAAREAARVKDVRMLGELAKFGVAAPSVVFGAFARCVDEFPSPDAVALYATLVDCVGRYLYLAPETHEPMERLLDVVKRARAAKGMAGGALGDALEAAHLAVVPPDRAVARRGGKVRTPLHAFVRHLLLDDLREDTVDDALRTLRKLPWVATEAAVVEWRAAAQRAVVAAAVGGGAVPRSAPASAPADAGAPATSGATVTAPVAVAPLPASPPSPPPRAPASVESLVVRTALTATRLDATRLELLASLLAGLRAYHDRAAVRVVDAVCERVTVALDGGRTAGTGDATASVTGEALTAPGADASPASTALAPPTVGGGGGGGGGVAAPRRRLQALLGGIRFLGEAYNFKLADSAAIFRVLYAMLNRGHALPEPTRRASVDAVNALVAAAAAEPPPPPTAASAAPAPAKAGGWTGGRRRGGGGGSGGRRRGRGAPFSVAAAVAATIDEGDEGMEDEDAEAVAIAADDGDDVAGDDGGTVPTSPSAPRPPQLSAALRRLLPRNPLPMPPTDPCVGGWGFHPLVPCADDPPSNLFRVRMACTLLDACGAFFKRGSAAGAKLDRFLVYFQRYALSKSPVPVDTEFAIADTFESLRPATRRFASFAEAEAAAAALERDEAFAAADAAAEAEAARRATVEARARAAGMTVSELLQAAATARLRAVGGADTAAAPVDDDDDDDDDSSSSDDDDEEEDEDEGDEEGDEDADDDEGGAAGDDDAADEAAEAAPPRTPTPLDGAALADAAADDEFERELARTVSESLESRRSQRGSGLGVAADHMAVPFAAVMRAASSGAAGGGGTAASGGDGPGRGGEPRRRRDGGSAWAAPDAADGSDGSDGSGGDGPGDDGGGAVRFMLLKRRSKGGVGLGKIEARPLYVPRGATFAEQASLAAEEARREAALLKQRTLRLHAAAEDDEERERLRAEWGGRRGGGGRGGWAPSAGGRPTLAGTGGNDAATGGDSATGPPAGQRAPPPGNGRGGVVIMGRPPSSAGR